MEQSEKQPSERAMELAEKIHLEAVGGYDYEFEADTATALIDAELAPLVAECERLKGVVESYGSQLRELRAEAQRVSTIHGEPKAWMLYCPKNHEFDALVFPCKEDAEDEREKFTDELPEGEVWESPIPLYAINPIEVERLKAELAALKPTGDAEAELEGIARRVISWRWSAGQDEQDYEEMIYAALCEAAKLSEDGK